MQLLADSVSAGEFQHEEMLSFVSVMIGILFCTSFWKRPKDFIIHTTKAIYKGVCNSLFPDASSDTTGIQMKELEYFQKKCDDYIKRLVRVLNFCYRVIYIPLTVICSITWLCFLFHKMVQTIGGWNWLICVPLIVYLLICINAFIYFVVKKNRCKSKILAHREIEEEAKNDMREWASNLPK